MASLFLVCAGIALVLAAVGLGIACGLALTIVLDRPLVQWTEARLWSPPSLVQVVIVLAIVGLCAIAVPVRRAVSSDPMTILRGE